MPTSVRRSDISASQVFNTILVTKAVNNAIQVGTLWETEIKRIGGGKFIPITLFAPDNVKKAYILPIGKDIILVKFVE